MSEQPLTEAFNENLTNDGQSNATKPRARAKRLYQQHGLHLLKRAVKEGGSRVMDNRFAIVKAMNRERAAILEDLGGREAVSTTALKIVNEIVTTSMMIESINAWLAAEGQIVNKRKRSLYSIVRERQALVDSMARLCSLVGLERRAKPVPKPWDYDPSKA